MGGWLDQVGIRLTQLSTKLKLRAGAELGKKNGENSCPLMSLSVNLLTVVPATLTLVPK